MLTIASLEWTENGMNSNQSNENVNNEQNMNAKEQHPSMHP